MERAARERAAAIARLRAEIAAVKKADSQAREQAAAVAKERAKRTAAAARATQTQRTAEPKKESELRELQQNETKGLTSVLPKY